MINDIIGKKSSIMYGYYKVTYNKMHREYINNF